LCGISPYGSFLRNDGYEKPVICRRYLLYSLILIVTISVTRLCVLIRLLSDSTNVISATHRLHKQIMLIFVTCFLTTYLVSTITLLIGQANFFKISRKLLSVGSFVNYREGTVFSNAVIALHFFSFVIYLIPYSFVWISGQCRLDELHNFISGLVCDTVTSFAALPFLYFVFTLRRLFMLLNSILNDVVVSTVMSESIPPLNVSMVSDSFPERYSVISSLRDILYRHVMLCDILELINSTFSLQVLALMGSKFVYGTIFLYLLFFSVFDLSLFSFYSFASAIPIGSFEAIQLVTVLYYCKSACLQVGIIWNIILRDTVFAEFGVLRGILLRVHLFWHISQCRLVYLIIYVAYIPKDYSMWR